MQISEIMSRDVAIAAPGDSVQKVAQKMAEIDAGIIPVGEKDRLVGMITDRDITYRAVAANEDLSGLTARDVMSKGMHFCFEDEGVDKAVQVMQKNEIHQDRKSTRLNSSHT